MATVSNFSGVDVVPAELLAFASPSDVTTVEPTNSLTFSTIVVTSGANVVEMDSAVVDSDAELMGFSTITTGLNSMTFGVVDSETDVSATDSGVVDSSILTVSDFTDELFSFSDSDVAVVVGLAVVDSSFASSLTLSTTFSIAVTVSGAKVVETDSEVVDS